jgi:hypothetical protein
MEHIFRHQQRVKHTTYGEGVVVSPITRYDKKKKRLIKNTYLVLFARYGSLTVHEKDLKEDKTWTTRSKTR